ncbi:hypothetical protein BH11PLA2_BH11PLA2_19750 [soil metagenome]
MNAILIATAALVGVPILLHLLMKQEPKRLPFPAMRFLQAKKRTNQRKLKLRHYLLMAMRMLLIALFGLAIFQPILPSTGLNFGLALGGEQPVACVIILDTSPSMGYVANGVSRFDEAKRRALELIDDLPANSKVAVLDPADPGSTWEQSAADARRKIEAIKEPHGAAVPVTTALSTAYQLLRTVDQESEQAEAMPRLVAIFSDRTTACWDAVRMEDLTRIRDAVPAPAVAHLFADIGVDQPSDVAIASLDVKPQIVPQNQNVVLNATLSSTGAAVEATLKCKVIPAGTNAPSVPEQTKLVAIPANGSQGVSITLPGSTLRPGLYQVEIKFDTTDNLAYDNIRFLTFKVAEARKILTISDDLDEATFWKLGHDVVGEFDCDLVRPADVNDLSKYEVVCVLNVTDPTALWPKLLAYAEAGGKVILLPGGERNVAPGAWKPGNSEAASRLLPAGLKAVFDTDTLPTQKNGLTWVLNEDALRHPMLSPMKDWKLKGNVDVIVRPRKAWKFWELEPVPEATTVVKYDNGDDPALRKPAIVERVIGSKGGKVLMLTTRVDTPTKDLTQRWNDYGDLDNSWVTVLPNLLVKYLAGNTADVVLNFTTGQALPLPVPRGGVTKLQIQGPGVTARDAEITLDAKQAEYRLSPQRTSVAGSFLVFTSDKAWMDGFSLNPPAEECSLSKVPVEGIETLLGKGSVVPVDRKLNLRDVLKLKSDQPLDLFPWLLIAVLLLMTLEGLIANRFYRAKS